MPTFDVTAQEEINLRTLSNAYQGNQIVFLDDINNALLALGAQFKSVAVYQTAQIVSGAIGIERQARFSYAELQNEAFAPIDDLATINSINNTSFVAGDFVVLRQSLPGQQTNIVTGGNISPYAGLLTIADLEGYAVYKLVRSDGNWQQAFPIFSLEQLKLFSDFAEIPASVPPIPQSVFAIRSRLYVKAINAGTEVLAEAEITITAASGTNGSISVHVLIPGAGSFTIGTASYSSATTVAAVLADLETSIDTGGSGYTASVVAPVITISAPVGSGATANGYTLSFVVTGGITATNTSFSGGSDATEDDGVIDSVLGMSQDKMLYLQNNMSANDLTIAAGGDVAVAYDALLRPGEPILLIGHGAVSTPFFSYPQYERVLTFTSPDTYDIMPVDRFLLINAATLQSVDFNMPLAAKFPIGKKLCWKVMGLGTGRWTPNGTEEIDGVTGAFAFTSGAGSGFFITDGQNWFSWG